MRAASPQTVDRVLGVLVAVCASAVLVAIGSRAGTSLTTFLRITYSSTNSGKGSAKRGAKRGSRSAGLRSNTEASAPEGVGDGGDDESPDEEGGDGDAYHQYAHGSRSAATAGSATGSARRGGRGRLVLHLGSCHCGGLAFEVEAPEHLVAIEGPSKVRYPFITVPAEHFRLTSDDSNGSLYLLKCRPPEGTDDTPKVSAHFFCRRCGVHVVHAPDFPHAAVADVNVHCIRPTTIKSLAVAFSRGGGVELPGIGDPVEGMYEVGWESWSDALRERLSVALQQQRPSESSSKTASNSGALSPHRRSASSASASMNRSGRASDNDTWDVSGRGVQGRGAESGAVAAGGDGGGRRRVRGGITALGAGGVIKTPDVSTLRRKAEERERARQHAGFSSSSRSSLFSSSSSSSSSANDGRTTTTGSTWGDVLMHVVSLPSSSTASSSTAGPARPRKALPNGVSGGTNASSGADEWRARASEIAVRGDGEERHRVTFGEDTASQGAGGVFPQGVAQSTNHRAAGGREGSGYVGEEDNGLRRRRSLSVDSGPKPSAASGPTRVVAYEDVGGKPFGGSRSSAGVNTQHGSQMGTDEKAIGVDYRPSAEQRGAFVRPPPAEGVAGGFAAAQA